ncbi:membrane protein insertase YidC [Hydrogenophaga intermedia]|jgi:YidC/Oxa1 family membrane protein insertase|uniref:membrane protein insertase YidC n=1 Tax=Hydrogenophaga intermedia TaxID=65786 RepID=UPI0020449877|nr:membrane protein insertase YidC [Hydrogenophaga intermedia]MCM3565487.1 membrane protein insertase YidC [Hydrogenophaga intermedia]
MNDIRRSILWVVFGFSMVLIWDKWQIHNGKPATFFPSAPPAATAPAQTGPASATGAAGTGSVPQASAQAAPAASGDVPGADSAAPSAANTRHVVRTDVMELTFQSEGGALVGARLLKHAQATGGKTATEAAPFTLLTQENGRTYVAQTGLIGGSFPTHKTPMTLIGNPAALADGQESLQVRFESGEVGGVQLATTYTLRRGAYDIAVSHEVINRGAAPVQPQLYRQIVRDGSTVESETPFYSTFTGPAIYTSEQKFQKVDFGDIASNKGSFVRNTSDGYVAMVQHYFATAWLGEDGQARENFVRKVADNLYSVGTISTLPEIAPGQSHTAQARLFVGPQDEKLLERLAPGLELVKDYGWLTILAKPLYWLLEKIHGYVANWGWAIVLLVVLIKAAFYWLNASAYRSMAKMKAINPRIMEMRERLKDNPQLMQQEMMKIYREEKVNPLGGCFPILVQIPVFIALYWVLLSSVEMRNAPWLGWITDLSSPDPFYILPLVMAVTTMIQTALNPLPPDPLQAKLMWMMPLVFSVMFFFFPSGLVLYWITNNVLTIAQQAHINHRMGVPLKFNMPKFK